MRFACHVLLFHEPHVNASLSRALNVPLLPCQGAKDFLGGMGLGMIASQLADLRLGELLDTPPPGLDEAVAIAKVMLQAALLPACES